MAWQKAEAAVFKAVCQQQSIIFREDRINEGELCFQIINFGHGRNFHWLKP